ncbi:hypothetical protein EMPS_10894 [Entomortierella parvispora]|uniref:XPG-I domain-containing protein n=1 Tax=Entomortierella parvispora TaxID=205924 RepID=A0A9P3M1Z3_9FUNG|nr:hypothetical protein EMPS_10894 [Entomortierella parvispora]
MQATYFGQLRSYYGYHTTKKWEIGHQKVMALINHFLQTRGVPKTSVVLYFDGKPCEEKQATAVSTSRTEKSLIAAKATVEDIQQRALHDKRVSKGLFNKAHRLLSSAHYFPAEIKSNLVQFLIQQGFDARVCSFEADPEIASDCQTHDVVVSRDSDMFAYDTIHTVVVPISNRLLVSAVEKVMSSLDLSRVQLTTFAIVSKNDYNKNVEGFGSSLYPSSKRHGSKQTFNPFRTIDRPSAADVSLAKNKHIKPRYSYHERQAKDHGPTLEAEQYYWKSYQKPAQEEESSKEDEDEDEDEVENDESSCAQEGNTVVDNAAVDGTRRRVHPREQMQRDLRRHHPFVTAKVGCLKANILQAWTDHQLAQLFWYHADLKSKLQEMVRGDFGGAGLAREPTLEDTKSWVGRQSPGAIVKEFVCRIGRNNLSRREQKKRGMKAKIIDANTLELETHLQRLGSEDFDPNTYEDKGCYLQGSITTNGTKLHVKVFKIRELNMVKYKRLPSDRMPVSPTSTIRGLDYFPSEIRHVFKNEGDVQRYYGDCSLTDITVVGIDPGDRFIVGVHVLLPESASSPSVQDPTISPSFRNLTISQKAAYQPILKHRAWLEEESKKMLRSVPLSAEAPLITASSAISPVSLPSLISPALLQSFSTPSVEGASTSSLASASNAQALSTAATNPRAHTTGPPDPELSTLLSTDAKAPPTNVAPANAAPANAAPANAAPANAAPAIAAPAIAAPAIAAPAIAAPAIATPSIAAPANIVPIDAEESIADILRHLPPLHGPQASFTKYMQEMEKVAEKLDAFYGSQKYKKRHWDLKKAMEAEFAIMADRIMKSFGGSIGRRRPDEKVLMAIEQGGSRYNKGWNPWIAHLLPILFEL